MIDFIMCKLVRNAASKGALKSVKALTIKRALDYEERQNVLDSESVINLAAQNHSLSQIPESIITLIAMDRDVLQRFFTRLTKGLLATFYSDVDYFDLKFAVTQLNQFGKYHPTFKTITSILTADQRGNGLFRFWHGVAQERRTAGVWIYQFYDAALFMVTHGKDA